MTVHDRPAPLRLAERSAIEERYRLRTVRSRELFARAEKVLPGGSSRQAAYWAPWPLFVDRACGTRLQDVDGHELIDLNYNYTALVHGHAYPPILDAVELARGTGWAANNEAMVAVAEQLVERVRSVQQVRFANSGTEAGLLALEVARAVTGRRKVLMCRHGYHGSLPELESGTFDRPGPSTLVADFGDAASFERVLAERGGEVAAVFVEPVMGAGGVVPASRELLEAVQAAAHRAGALFVLDEVITLRLGWGGRQGALGIEPDLTMFGKLLGGGFPVGALGGRAELMRVFHPEDLRLFHSGTFNANPVTMAAGDVALRELTEERIDEMDRLAARLEEGLRAAAARSGLPCAVRRVGSLLNLFLSERAPRATAERTDLDAMRRLHLAAINRGVLFAPRGMMALATVVDDACVDETVGRIGLALADLAAELE